MFSKFYFALHLSLLVLPFPLWGQVDTLLLKGSKEAPQGAAVENGRYQIRNEPPLAETVTKTGTSAGTPEKKRLRKRVPSSEAPTVDPKAAVATGSTNEKEAKPIDPPSVADQMKGLVLGEQQPTLEAYREQVHPDDVRLNRLEINLVPGYFYEESKSTYSYRNYQFFSPDVQVGATIWLTPFIGLAGSYGTTIGADISESGSNSAHVPVSNEVTRLSLEFRKFYGYSRKSNSLVFGLHFYENKFSVPGDNLKRVKTRSSGLGIHFDARFPTAPTYAWILGGSIEPRLSHTETATGISVESGSNPQSSRVGLKLGGEFKLSRENQIIWDLSFAFEKNQYSGSANLADPETSLTPTGVSVSHSQSLFSLGYRWGH